jgi:hypothetical protein
MERTTVLSILFLTLLFLRDKKLNLTKIVPNCIIEAQRYV